MSNEFRNEQYARAAKLFSTMLVDDCFTGKKRPSDLDSVAVVAGPSYLCHTAKTDNFLYFECKTVGAEVPRAQWMIFDGLAMQLRNRFTLFVVSHGSLSTTEVNLFDGVESMSICHWIEGEFRKTQTFAADIETLKYWCAEWEARSLERPNDFETFFRYAVGLMPRPQSDSLSLAGMNGITRTPK